MSKKLIFSSLFDPLYEEVEQRYKSKGILTEGLEPSADLYGIPLPDIQYKGEVFHSVQLRYTKKHKAITMMRFLLSKMVYTPDTVERIDILLMYEQILKCQDIAMANDSFQQKFGSALEAVSKILKGFRLKPKTTNLDIRKLGKQISKDVPNFIYPERNLRQVGQHVNAMFYVSRVTPLGTEVKHLPPKAYIGKGYTDKGTASDPAFDGSPSWQDVATFFSLGDEE